MSLDPQETELNLISSQTRLEGNLSFDKTTRVHGTIVGTVRSHPGSILIIAESGVVEGTIECDELCIDGYVKGNIQASGKVKLSSSARLLGDVHSPSFSVEFGAFFEGQISMPQTQKILTSKNSEAAPA